MVGGEWFGWFEVDGFPSAPLRMEKRSSEVCGVALSLRSRAGYYVSGFATYDVLYCVRLKIHTILYRHYLRYFDFLTVKGRGW